MYIHGIFFCVIYVDDCILISKEGKYIDALVEKNCDQKFDPEHEVQKITDCLCLNFAKTGKGNDKTIKFTMDHHIDRIMQLTGINKCTPKDNPVTQTPLGTDINGSTRRETDKWIYTAAVDMLQYSAWNTRPGTNLAVKQAAFNNHNRKLSHEITIKHN